MSQLDRKKDWWIEFHDDHLVDSLLESRDDLEIKKTLDFIVTRLGISKGDSVYDQCCGVGSLSYPLAERGMKVIGVDRVSTYIEKANKRKLNDNVSFFEGDASNYKIDQKFDGAFNWWTCIGYEKREADLGMLKNVFVSLKSNSKFLLDTMNLVGVIKNFKKEVSIPYKSNDSEAILKRTTEFDYKTGRMIKKWQYSFTNKEDVIKHSSVRAYMPWELIELFKESGFNEIQLFGDLDGSELTEMSPRCIVEGKKCL